MFWFAVNPSADFPSLWIHTGTAIKRSAVRGRENAPGFTQEQPLSVQQEGEGKRSWFIPRERAREALPSLRGQNNTEETSRELLTRPCRGRAQCGVGMDWVEAKNREPE